MCLHSHRAHSLAEWPIYECGMWPDIEIFRDSLIHQLDHLERVEADDGYVGEAPRRVKCPMSFTNKRENERMQSIVRCRHETVNKRFKHWKILDTVFRHGMVKHGDVFRAVAVITQLAINDGERLFQVNYDPVV